MNYFKKVFHQESTIGRIISAFSIIFVIILIPVVIQTYASFRQVNEYRNIIDNIDNANQLKNIVKTQIESTIWDIVAGKVKFDESDIRILIKDLRFRMYDIRENTYSLDNRAIIDVALRTVDTLENYVDRLERQIYEKFPVSENEQVLEVIRGVVALINDLLQDFTSKQLDEVAKLNGEMTLRSNYYFLLNILLIIVVIFVGIVVVLYISKSVIFPIRKLRSMAGKISDGNFSARVNISAAQELNELAFTMNTMASKIELLLEKSLAEQKNLQISEIKALQAQITPHFLYNTLDAIIWAAEAKNTDDVIKLVSSLSSFFRISLSHGIDFIPISNEIEHVRSYLIIQQMRYSDILTYEIDVDKSISEVKILKLLLQPLVENSLYHGIRNTRERGKIMVSVKKIESGILFIVSDTGIGIAADKLEALRSDLKMGTNQRKGYGLYNVNRRLQLYYNIKDGISINSEYLKGTQVSFIIPMY